MNPLDFRFQGRGRAGSHSTIPWEISSWDAMSFIGKFPYFQPFTFLEG